MPSGPLLIVDHRCRRPVPSAGVLYATIIIFSLCFTHHIRAVASDQHGGNPSTTAGRESIVSELRALLLEHFPQLPDPPRGLGIHMACKKFGMGCPDTYIDFLRQAAAPYRSTSAPVLLVTGVDSQQSLNESKTVNGGRDARRSKAHPESLPLTKRYITIDPSWSVEEATRLENLESLLAVWEARVATIYPQQPLEVLLFDNGTLRDAPHSSVVVQVWWSLRYCRRETFQHWRATALVTAYDALSGRAVTWVGLHLLPTVVVVVLLWSLVLWVVLGGPSMPSEVRGYVLAVTAEVTSSAAAAESAPPEGEETHESKTSTLVAPSTTRPTSRPRVSRRQDGSGVRTTSQRHREAVSYSLLRHYMAHRISFFFLRLRLVLSVGVLLMLLCTLYAFTLQVYALVWPPDSVGLQRVDRSWAMGALEVLGSVVLRRVVPPWLIHVGVGVAAATYLGGSGYYALRGVAEAVEEHLAAEVQYGAEQERILEMI